MPTTDSKVFVRVLAGTDVAVPRIMLPARRLASIPPRLIERSIYKIRDQKVMLDSDLARLYQVETKALVQAVRRNAARFPVDFMFQLTPDEFRILRSQSVTSSAHGGRRYPPCVFTEQGVAMLSSVLRSSRAIQVNMVIMRTFVRLREFLVTHEQIAHRLVALERKYDGQFQVVFEAIRELTTTRPRPSRRIGFRIHEKG